MVHEDAIPSYLNRLTQAPLLTVDEERVLTRRCADGDEDAKNRLIESNMRLVINIAKTYRCRTVPLEDLIQEGAIGLMQAVERFDPDKGFRFSTYATHWIRQAIGRAIDNKAKAIRLPSHISQSLRKLQRERDRILNSTGSEPTLDQLATAMNVSPAKVLMLIQASHELLSLDMTVGENGSSTLGGLLRDTSGVDPDEAIHDREILRALSEIITELSEREQKVMRLRFKIDGADLEGTPHEDIARELKLSRERVRQIELQAIKKLRAVAQRRRLYEMLTG
ncbi:MAG: RNA polymerase sigma factor RpoD/SigA [Fimbriimonadaceae bacterium]